FIRMVRSAVPEGWLARVPALRELAARRDLGGGGARELAKFAPESATYAVGLAARSTTASLLAGATAPSAAPWAMAGAELCGYIVWGLLAVVPLYPDRTLLPLTEI